MKSIPTHPFFLLLLMIPILAIGQTATLKGIVLNEQNQPIQGANIVSDEEGTTTNLNGFYTLKIPAKKMLKSDSLT